MGAGEGAPTREGTSRDVVVRWAATGEVGSLGALAARLRGGIALREVRAARVANVGLTEIGRFVMIMIHVYVECN